MTEYTRGKAFHFFTSIGNYTGEYASSLEEFGKKIKTIDNKSLEFHLNREDFQRWIRDILTNEELAEELDQIMRLNLKGELLRTRISEAVLDSVAGRRRKKRKKKRKTRLTTETPSVEETSKEYPPPYQEHAYELKMEKHLKRLLKEQKSARTRKRKL